MNVAVYSWNNKVITNLNVPKCSLQQCAYDDILNTNKDWLVVKFSTREAQKNENFIADQTLTKWIITKQSLKWMLFLSQYLVMCPALLSKSLSRVGMLRTRLRQISSSMFCHSFSATSCNSLRFGGLLSSTLPFNIQLWTKVLADREKKEVICDCSYDI